MSRLKEEGFTLLEIVVGVTLMAIVVGSLAVVINNLATVNDRARDLTHVTALVEHKAEAIRSLGFVALSDGSVDFTSELPVTVASPRTATYTVSTVNSGLKQIDFTVSYNDHGNTRTIQYRSYVGELGVAQ